MPFIRQLDCSVTRTYAYGLQRISQNQLSSSTWTPSFYGYDGHGSVRFLTNINSSVTDTYKYDAFGNLIASTGSTPNNYLFSGEQFDPPLGLYQMRARWYRETTGRFMSRDPLEGVLCCGLSWNPYIYVKDNPVNAIDPTGRAELLEMAKTLEELEAKKIALGIITRRVQYQACVAAFMAIAPISGLTDFVDMIKGICAAIWSAGY